MKFGGTLFGVITAFALFSMASETFSPVPYPDAFDSRVKLTSLVSSAQILERPPVLLPLPEDIKKNIVAPADYEPEIAAQAALIFRLQDGEELLKFNAEGRHPLASLTKLMTAIIAVERMGLARGITLNEDDIAQEGSAGDFASGEVFSVEDMISSMFVASSNDAAGALSRVYGARSFVDAMQQKAAELGMGGTSFAESIGFTSLNQSTARDVGVLIKYINARHPYFFKAAMEKEVEIKELTFGKTHSIKNINKFAGRDDFRGGKTGYTEEAGGNLVSIFRTNGSDFVIIVLGATDSEARFIEAERLYEWLKGVL